MSADGQPETAAAAHVGRTWRLPSAPVLVLVAAALLGLVGIAWSEREVFHRVGQRATSVDWPMPNQSALARWPTVEGSAVWSYAGGPSGGEIHAAIDLPPLALTLDLVLRKNDDASLPASHIIEITVQGPTGLQNRQIADIGPPVFTPVPGGSGGRPLAGVMVRIAEGSFLFGLSPVPADVAGNLKAMKQNFIELPLVFHDGQPATLTFEKGSTGTPVFDRVLPGWSQG